MGYRLLILCLRQVWENWRVALRVSWFWVLLSILADFITGRFYGLDAGMQSSSLQTPEAASVLVFMVASLVSYCILFLAITAIGIGWHRYILLKEEPQRFYVMRTGWPVGWYALQSFVFGLIFAAVVFPLIIILPFVPGISPAESAAGLNSSQMIITISVILLLAGTIAGWLILRLGLVLPAMAVGERLTVADSFRLTRPVSRGMVVIAFCFMVLSFIPLVLVTFVGVVDDVSAGDMRILLLVSGHVVSWIVFLVGIGVLTAAYRYLARDEPD